MFRGIRQGCPVSPYLFVIESQLFTSYLLNSSLQGINIANNHILISQLADDTTLFLSSSQIPVAIDYIKVFSKVSGLTLIYVSCLPSPDLPLPFIISLRGIARPFLLGQVVNLDVPQ